MARVFPIAIFSREVFLLGDIPIVEYFELEQNFNRLVFIIIFFIGILFIRTINTCILLTLYIIDFIWMGGNNLVARKAFKFVHSMSTLISVT